MNSKSEKPTVGLALGGGATLGAAHVGVLKAIEEMAIDVHCISGTSVGAFVAALYAFGTSPASIEEEIRGLNWLDISGISFERIKLGLFSNDKLGKSVKKMLGNALISDSEIPLAIVATDIASGKKVELTECAVSQAVMASTAVPGIFAPVEIDGQMLVDGGLVENVPITPLRKIGADLVIGVDLSARRSYRKPDDLIDVLMNSIDVAIDTATRLQTSKADIVISPELSAYSRTDTAQISELVDEGFEAARTTINDSDLH
jgi:NTE family protein